jgi:methylated-DNA-[protein]-cysteine S-methyltransferase
MTRSTIPLSATPVSATTMPSPIGELTIGVSDLGVRFVMWQDEPGLAAVQSVDGGDTDRRAQLLGEAVSQLKEYFAGERMEFDLPLDPQGTAFQHEAWTVLRRIPYGSTMSYGEQARALGDPNKARAVGAANGRNPIGIVVPCHRVVGANGSLTGFAGGIDAKAWLLDHERRIAAAAG